MVAQCNGTVFARDVANERSDAMSPQTLQDLAVAVGASHDMMVSTIVGSDLKTLGLNMLYAVGQAAT